MKTVEGGRATYAALRAAVIAALGFFALVSQALLFRDFLTAFEGNELGIGSFFASWLVWVAMGALAGRIASPINRSLAQRFELAALLYIPAFVLQHYLILNARALAGVEAYEVFPFAPMFATAFLANAPISMLTGYLFTLACRWASKDHAMPVARVYILETLGSCVGGIAVTVLLARGVPAETVFLWASLVVALAAGLFHVSGAARERRLRRVFLAIGPPAVLAAALWAGVGGPWAQSHNRAAWRRLLPADEYRGSFTTAQAKYLYGERAGQFIVMSAGSVCEALPNIEPASEIVALNLAQRPGARNVLVVGPDALAVCARLLRLETVEKVTWLHPDPDYPGRLMKALPERFAQTLGQLDVPGLDPRTFLSQTGSGLRYDIVMLNLPDASTLVLNRYSSQEFFAHLAGKMTQSGVVSIRISGGANYLGGELAYLGASALTTLESAFENVVLKPGDETWLFASDGDTLTDSPAVLRGRFASIEGAADVYPPEGLLSLFPEDRIEFQMSKYRQVAAEVDPAVLLNTDTAPKALLYSLLLALRRITNVSFAGSVPVLLTAGPWICACAVAVYGLLRLTYLLKGAPVHGRNGIPPSSGLFDGQFLVFSMGLTGMSLSILLMFLYQSRFGSLYLSIGLITSLFMLGTFAGSLVTERILVRRGDEPRYLAAACVLSHLALIFVIYQVPESAARVYFAFLFAVCGVFTGVYFPIAAHRLQLARRTAAAAGARLETVDHLGGAMGAVLTGLLMLPVFGGPATLSILAALVAVNLAPLPLPTRTRRMADETDQFARIVRPAGYVLFGVGAFALIASQLVARARAGAEGELLTSAALSMVSGPAATEAGHVELHEKQAQLPNGKTLTYFEAGDPAGSEQGFVFSTANLTKEIYGYGGPIALAVYVDRDGALNDYQLIQSNETPAYVAMLEGWEKVLSGRNIFERDPFHGVDAVSGATVTAHAILRALEESGQGFASQVLGRDVAGLATASAVDWWRPDRDFLALTLLMALAIAIRYRPRRWLRRLFLLASVLVAGVFLNMQYSTQHSFSLLSLRMPAARPNGAFFLVLLVPASALLFGNVYCGYLCPFGALQELLGDLRPRRFTTDPAKMVWRYGRAVKYLLLLLVVLLFARTRDFAVLSADPLITVFGAVRTQAVLVMSGAILLLALVFRRFWCRNLCPAGAILALLSGPKLLGRYLPGTRPTRCDLGVQTSAELDCIHCDRCKHDKG